VTGQHAKPTLAFIVLVVLAAAVIGSSYRADADNDLFSAEGSVSADSSTRQNAVPTAQPEDDEHGDVTTRATRPSRGGAEREELPPAPAVVDDSGDLAGTHTVTSADSERWLPRAHGAGHPKKSSHPRDGACHGHGEHLQTTTD